MEQKETIEQSLRRLEEIVERLGEETVTLDDSLALFAEGMKLSQKCLQQLEDAAQCVIIAIKATKTFVIGKGRVWNENHATLLRCGAGGNGVLLAL